MTRILSLALVLAVGACAKTPITHEKMWLMKRVGAPQPSPDGKWVVFPVVEPAYDDKEQVSDLWIVPAGGGAAPRRLTATKTPESGVAWSPDSTRIAFSAKRDDDVPQIYILDVAGGGEAVRLTSLSTGASSPAWSPDGRHVAFTSNAYPGAADDEANKRIAAERKARKYRARTFDAFPIRYWDKWLEDTRVHLFVQTLEAGKSLGYAKGHNLLAGTKLVSEPGFGGTFSTSGEELQYVWSPDSSALVFSATTTRNAAAHSGVAVHLYEVGLKGGEPRQLTKGSDSYTKPKFRPDGKALYALHGKESGLYSLDRLVRFEWPQVGQAVPVSGRLDRSVGSFAFSPDSRTVFFLAEDAGHEKPYSLPAAGGRVSPVLEVKQGVYTNLAIPAKSDSTLLIANWESAVSPAEVVRIDPETKRARNLSNFNTEAAKEIDWEPVRHFEFTAKNGRRVHNMVVLPPAFDASKKYPLLSFIHGGPHTMHRDQFFLRWNYHMLARPGIVVLMTNYSGSTGFGEKFAQAIEGDPLKGPAEEIAQAEEEAIRQFSFIDGTRRAAAGASYGGHLANWLQATTTRYRCLVSHAGLINLESQWGTSDVIFHREATMGGPYWEGGKVWTEQNPIRYAKNFKTPILLTVGENDYRVPLNQTIENWSVLQRMKVPSRLIVFPDANHWITKGEDSRYFYRETLAWVSRWLGLEVPADDRQVSGSAAGGP